MFKYIKHGNILLHSTVLVTEKEPVHTQNSLISFEILCIILV